MNFSIMSGQESVYTDKISDSEFGYEVDTDEIDLNDVYEVTFRIKKGE